MSRYFSYLLLLNLFGNSIAFVPTILLEQRFKGAVSALVIGALMSSVLIWLTTYSFSKTPRLGLPEMLNLLPKWIRGGMLFLIGFVIFTAGCLTLLIFNDIIIRFINPDIHTTLMILFTTIFILTVIIYLSSLQVLFLLEIVLVFISPFMIFVLIEAITSPYFRWNDVKEVAGYAFQLPPWSTLSATSYVFTGYANTIIFNRVFHVTHRAHAVWLMPLIIFLAMVLNFFTPIGILGADIVDHFTFPWVATSDALHIKLGPIERLTMPFLLFYVAITIISIIIHWHVAFKVWGLLPEQRSPLAEVTNKVKLWPAISIIVGCCVVMVLLDWITIEPQVFRIAEKWLNVRFLFEIAMAPIILLIARRKRRAMSA